MITAHRLPEEAFTILACDAQGSLVVRHLREAQHSKDLLLRAVGKVGIDIASPGLAAFRARYKLLAAVR